MHTPGPWDYDVYDGHDALACNDASNDYTARIEWREGMRDEERLSNLHLISAAPDLYEALQFVRRFYQDNFDNMPVSFQTVDTLCEQALAKAEGKD